MKKYSDKSEPEKSQFVVRYFVELLHVLCSIFIDSPEKTTARRVSTTATIAQIPAVSSKEGAVIGAVISTRKFHH
jgi:hypothetical protein